jgi:hypothetical protein
MRVVNIVGRLVSWHNGMSSFFEETFRNSIFLLI